MAMRALTRRQFHQLAVLGAGAALVPACSNGAAPNGNVALSNGQAILSFEQFPMLANVGGSALVTVTNSFPLVAVRTGDATAVALSATCTHAGCLIELDAAANDLRCPCHNATFSLAGDVLGGPTIIPLPIYDATVGAAAITVQIA
jgi:cytochrome b6-f complex iron-sulfur subunit